MIPFSLKLSMVTVFFFNSSKVIQGAGHYVFADQSEDFNQAVLKICNNECIKERKHESGQV